MNIRSGRFQLICALTFFSALLPTLSAELVSLDLGPMMGHVGPNEARIWVKAAAKTGRKNASQRNVSIHYGTQPDLSDGRTVRGSLMEGPEFLGQINLTGLKPATRYFYRVSVDGESVTANPPRSFQTAPVVGTPGKFRFAFISCLGRKGSDAAAAWGDLAARTPIDMVLFLGDNHYADSTEPARQRAAYYEHRSVAGFRDLSSRLPSYAIWDDHDFGPNNSDSTSTGKEISLQTFKGFWPNPAYGQREDPGVYFKFARGDVDFFMLDVRYHRSPNESPDDGSKTMLGAPQLAWLKRELLASKATIKFLASGSEWQSNGSDDSWSRFNRERMDLLNFIQDKGIRGVILLSGDLHFTAMYQVLGKFVEVTSGPFGSNNSTRTQPTAETSYFQNTGKLYCVFDVDTTGVEPKIALEVYRAAEGLIQKREFAWNEILGHQNPAPRAGWQLILLPGRNETVHIPMRNHTVVACAVVLASISCAFSQEQKHAARTRLDRTNLLTYRDGKGQVRPVKSKADWQKRRAETIRGMQEIMGPLPDKPRRIPPAIRIADETDHGSYIRRLITYESEPDSQVPAYLLIPKEALIGKKKFPAVLALHPTDMKFGHRVLVEQVNKNYRAYANELAERGFVVLAPAYPVMANYQPDLKSLGYESGTMKAIGDNIRGLDLLDSLRFVKRGKYGALGHSLGGHNAIYTAVFDQRIKVIVSSCGFDSFLDYYGGDPKNWESERGWCQTRYMLKLADYRGRLEDIPFDFHELIGALAPRPVFVNAPLGDSNFTSSSVDEIVKAASAIYRLYDVPQNLKVEHPDCGHDFPETMRETAYRLLNEQLR